MKHAFGSAVLDMACRLLIPFHMIFALYVVFHGHSSPGGGFQGGTILAATFILIRVIRGETAEWGIFRRGALRCAAIGVLLYTAIGFFSLFRDKAFLDYSALPFPLDEGAVRAAGSMGIEIGVALGVMGVLLLIYQSLAETEEADG